MTLITREEMEALNVAAVGEAVIARHMSWFHLPIADVSVPDHAFEQTWMSAGPQLRSMLSCGFKVLVHCKGGLGRAGMIAARLATELGMAAESAIAAVRSVRPGAIETRVQEAHVLGTPAVAEPMPDTSAQAIRDRAVGALLGLAVGDAFGTTLEFSERDRYPILTDMVGGGPFRLAPVEWTDDTSMALVLADVLARSGEGDDGLDEHLLMERFCAWQESGAYSHNGRCFDIGVTVRAALRRFKASGEPVAGSTDPQTVGNGSLMRLAPVAIRFWQDRPRMRDVAARQSRTTHGAAEAVDACVAYAELLADAIEGKPVVEVLAPRAMDLAPSIASIIAGSWRGKPRGQVRGSGYVVHSLEAALWSVGRSGSFARAVIAAANLGEDADTTAAIAGQLAGALHGASDIPGHWVAQLAWQERIVQYAEALLPREIANAA